MKFTEIKKSVPIPPKGKRTGAEHGLIAVLRKMEIGDCIEVQCKHAQEPHAAAHTAGIKITQRKLATRPGWFGVWRIA